MEWVFMMMRSFAISLSLGSTLEASWVVPWVVPWVVGPTVAVAASERGIVVVKTSDSVKIGSPPEYIFVYL